MISFVHGNAFYPEKLIFLTLFIAFGFIQIAASRRLSRELAKFDPETFTHLPRPNAFGDLPLKGGVSWVRWLFSTSALRHPEWRIRRWCNVVQVCIVINVIVLALLLFLPHDRFGVQMPPLS
jgi:hypothetical protein